MPVPIQNATAWGKLQAKFGILGRHKLLLDEVVVPVVVVEDLASQGADTPEGATIAVFLQGVAATTGAAVFANLTSATNLFLDKITFSSGTTNQFDLRRTTIAPILPLAGSEIGKVWNDSGQAGIPAGDGFANEFVFGAGTLLGTYQVALGRPQVVEPKLVVGPGSLIVLRNFTQNQTFFTIFNYRVGSVTV